MKCLNFLLIGAILVASASCKKQSQVQENTSNYLALNKLQSFALAGQTISCTLDSVVQDSRCPNLAVCVWQGMAVARFNVSLENTQQTITLSTTKIGEYDTNTTVGGFKIELIDVSPYPELNKPTDYKDYVAKINITKQ